MNEFGRQLLEDLKRKHISQTELGNRIDLSQGRIGHFIAGTDSEGFVVPPEWQLPKLAAELDADPRLYWELICRARLEHYKPDLYELIKCDPLRYGKKTHCHLHELPVAEHVFVFTTDNPAGSPLRTRILTCAKIPPAANGMPCLVNIGDSWSVPPYNRELMQTLTAYRIRDAQ